MKPGSARGAGLNYKGDMMVKPEDQKIITQDSNSIPALVRATIEQLGGMENAESAVGVVKELVAMQRDQERWDSEKEFYAKLSEFQEACPQIEKTKSTGKASEAGGKFSFMYAPLDQVERTVRPHLQPLGFSFYWDGKTTKADGEYVREITFHLLHKNGHRTSSSISAPITKEIGSMKGIQLFGAGESYLKRYTMLAGLGIPTTDSDGISKADPTTISDDEIKAIESKAKEATPDTKGLLEYLKVKEFKDIRKVDYRKAMADLDRKIKANKAKKDGTV